MKSDYSRTKKGIRNGAVSLAFKLVLLVLGFFSRKVFLDCLGSEILGVDSIAKSILGFLNIAELGIGSAVAVTLYKPLFDNDRKTIQEVIALQGWLYKCIACFIIVASIVIAFFFPSIFSKTDLPLWYAYVCFASVLFGSLIGNFVNYKCVVLFADQNDYKVNYSHNSVMVVKVIAQILCMTHCPGSPFWWWIGIEVAGVIVSSITLNLTIYHSYPYLKEHIAKPYKLIPEYPNVTTKVKQVFIHKMGSLVISQSSPIIIYAFTSLSAVTLYYNYTVLTNSMISIIASVFSGLAAGLGNLAAENDSKTVVKVFREQFSARFLIAAVCSICFWELTQSFVCIWLGEEYLLSKLTLALIVILFYFSSFRYFFESYLNAYGLFDDIWCPAVEAVITIVASILFGKFWGLNGIIAGAIAGQVFIHIWKAIFLLWKGVHIGYWQFQTVYLKHLAMAGLTFVLTDLAIRSVQISPTDLQTFLPYAAGVFLMSTLVLLGLLMASDSGMRSFVVRLKKVLLG